MTTLKLGIPYMGSKRQLAHKIVDYILLHNPNTKYVYDLFGGGGAISFEFLQKSQIKQVFYNELNTGVCELLRKIQKDGVTDEFFNWVDRDTFNKLKNGSDWKAGLVKTCWSFGNNQRGYLYGKTIENLKKQATEYLFANGYDRTREKRVILLNKFKEEGKIKGRFDLEQLQHLEQLQQLERLQQLQRLEISNLSYENVKITTSKEETIIYLDPPYINTGQYQEKLNHDELYSWIDKKTKEGYKIYLSSYESELPLATAFPHRSSLSATNNSKKTLEKLFTNIEDVKLELL